MLAYIVRRLMLLPITLFCIVLVNFLIINMAPGDPVSVTDVSKGVQNQGYAQAFGSDDRYLIFREFYGLTLPILFNTWTFISKEEMKKQLNELSEDSNLLTSQKEKLKIQVADESRYQLKNLFSIVADENERLQLRLKALSFFKRGTYRNAYIGPSLNAVEEKYNKELTKNNLELESILLPFPENELALNNKIPVLKNWLNETKKFYQIEPSTLDKIKTFFFETRFFRYMSRVVTLDFGTLRADPNKTVVNEVTKRFKYSLTLSILPMFITFFCCLFFGFIMALNQNKFLDRFLNALFLILYAIPIFVVAPFLIENVGLKYHFPFTKLPIPIHGFTSNESVYANELSYQRLFDVLRHIFLPLIAIMYGMLAVQSRLARTAVLEVLRQDYVKTAKAKGASLWAILTRHVGKNAAITIVTSLAGSLGLVLGGSLIVETLFEIDGFGRFFYEAIVSRDYNVIMFSALASSFLTLTGYLIADIVYMLLDPRITLD